MSFKANHAPVFVLLECFAFSIPTSYANGGIIAGLPSLFGPGAPLGTPYGETVLVNNDNAGGENPNQISLVGISITGVAPIDVSLPVLNSPGASGVTEYLIELGTAWNNTSVAWSGFEIVLGSGVGIEFVRLSESAIPGVSGLDFDTPDRDPVVVSSSFPTIVHNSDAILLSGGLVPIGGVANGQNFSIDIPDTSIAGISGYEFTIRLLPATAELLAGDFDQDGDVDGSDFLMWQRDASDAKLVAWQRNFPHFGDGQLIRALDATAEDLTQLVDMNDSPESPADKASSTVDASTGRSAQVPEPQAEVLLASLTICIIAKRNFAIVGRK
ncbi:MAG: hypothetical protein KDA61_13640 [Planctomycetales bacterium]|nr:hypothetical protein [Planctomycetales bacterium]